MVSLQVAIGMVALHCCIDMSCIDMSCIDMTMPTAKYLSMLIEP